MSGQTWNARSYAENARFVAEHGVAVVDLLAPKPGERILDLGCGDGALTVKIAAAGASVVGADSSRELIAAALGLGLDARAIDGQNLPFDNEFDAVFSNAALHWMPEPDRVIAGVRRALVPSGRFVGEFGGHGNVAAISTAFLGALRTRGIAEPAGVPMYFPTTDAYARKLTAHGFAVESIASIPRPTVLPTGMRGWLDTFGAPFLTNVPPESRADLLDEVESLLALSLRDDQGRWTADYVRLRFSARKA